MNKYLLDEVLIFSFKWVGLQIFVSNFELKDIAISDFKISIM